MDDSATTAERRLTWGIGILAALFIFGQALELPRLGELRGDETYYIEAGEQMIRTGDWLVPRWESGEERFNKPILTYWAVAGGMKLFGINVAAARLPSVIFVLATVPFVYGLARILLRDRRAALFAAVAQLALRGAFSSAHQARTDAILAFCVVAAIYFFARLIFEPGRERRDAMLAWAATGATIMVKGMIVIPFIVLPLPLFLILARRRLGWRWKAVLHPLGLAMLAVAVAPWYVAMLARYRESFTQMFIGDQVTRNLGGAKSLLITFPLNVLVYVSMFLRDTLPWGAAALVALAVGRRRLLAGAGERRDGWLFLGCWLAPSFLVFSIAHFTRGRYLLPVAPVGAIAAGWILARLAGAPRRLAALLPTAAFVGGFAILCGAGFIALNAGAWRAAIVPAPGYGLVALLALGVGLAVILSAWKARVETWAILLSATFLLAVTGMNALRSSDAPYSLTADLARAALAETDPGTPIFSVGLDKAARTAVLLATGRRVEGFIEPGTDMAQQVKFVRRTLARPGVKALLMDESLYEKLPDDAAEPLRLVGNRTGIERAGLEGNAPGVLRPFQVRTVNLVAVFAGATEPLPAP